MRRSIVAMLSLAVLVAAGIAAAADPELKTDDDKAFYALGQSLGQSLGSFALTSEELEFVKAGLTDNVLKRPAKVEVDKMRAKLQEIQRTRMSAAAAEEKKAGEAFLAKAAGEKGATKTASGLVYQEITAGTGESPKATDRVKVHYRGTLTDGTEFDSSIKRGQPATFALNGVVKCWTEGVQLMKVGGKSKLICPSDIAYGDRGMPPLIKPGSTLVFEVELLGIEK